MNILKKILLGVLALLTIPLILAVFMKKSYVVERQITINQPVDSVFSYIKLLDNQDYYSTWNMMDKGMKKTKKGIDGTVGYIYGWDSTNDQLGAGEQEILKIEASKRIDFALRFKRPFESEGTTFFETTAIDSMHTNLKWSMSGSMAYPTNVMMLFMNMDDLIGKDFKDGLDRVKLNLEK